MNHRNTARKAILVGAALLVLAGQASAASNDWQQIEPEIRSCVTAVDEHANFDDATRVRHAVTQVKERTVGYKLTIQTSIYDESGNAAIREYATSCVVNGAYAPLQFSISEIDNDA